MKLNRLLVLTLAVSLVIHFLLFFGVRIPRPGKAEKAPPSEKKILLSFSLPAPPASNPKPGQKPSLPKKSPSKSVSKKQVKKPLLQRPKRPRSKPEKLQAKPRKIVKLRKPPAPRKPSQTSKIESPSPKIKKIPTTPAKVLTAKKTEPKVKNWGENSPQTKPRRLTETPSNLHKVFSPAPRSSKTEINELKKSYLSLILARIEKNRYYPRLARLRNYEGRVGVLLEISARGDLLSARVIKSSGHRILDRAALKIIRRSAPFPPPPTELNPPLKFKIFLRFHLERASF